MEGERVRVELIPFESRVGNRISAPREFAQHDQGAIWDFSAPAIHLRIETSTREGSPDPDDYFDMSLQNLAEVDLRVVAPDLISEALLEAGVQRKCSLIPRSLQDHENTFVLYLILTDSFMHTILLQTTVSTLAVSETFFDAIVASFRGI